MDETFDYLVYLYNSPNEWIEDTVANELLSRFNARVVYCGNEEDNDIVKHLNGNNFYIIFSDGRKPKGFSCPKNQFMISDMVKTILKNLDDEE